MYFSVEFLLTNFKAFKTFISMGRYLCQLCWSVVHFGEKHLCFFYKNDDVDYRVQPIVMELEQTERRSEETEESLTGNSNQNNPNICAEAQTNHNEGCKGSDSSVIEKEEVISLVPAWETKRRQDSIIPGNKRGEPEDAKKNTQVKKKKKNASAEATRRVDSSGVGEATCSSALSSVAVGEAENVAGPSGIRTQSPGSENERAFVCAVCGRCFSGIGHLNRHRRTQACEKRFACSMCDKEFVTKTRLEIHSRTHTGEKQFPCDICGKRFSQKQHLKAHHLTHTGDKPFECDLCGKRCSTKHHLVVHRRTHTGEKPFKCKRCGRDFAYPNVYRRHLKKCTAKMDAHLGAKK